MTDKQDAGIVDRLRQAGNDYTIEWGNGDLYDEAADEIERRRKRVDELSDLLTSARAIAERFGNNTHWERFSARLGAAGIGSITPRTFRVLPSDTPTPPKDE